jgi:hypothetical protein
MPRWRHLVPSDHFWLLTKVFLLNIVLVGADFLTDVILSMQFFGRGDFRWGLLTTFVIMQPMLAAAAVHVLRILSSLKNRALAKYLLLSLPNVLCRQSPIRWVEHF